MNTDFEYLSMYLLAIHMPSLQHVYSNLSIFRVELVDLSAKQAFLPVSDTQATNQTSLAVYYFTSLEHGSKLKVLSILEASFQFHLNRKPDQAQVKLYSSSYRTTYYSIQEKSLANSFTEANLWPCLYRKLGR